MLSRVCVAILSHAKQQWLQVLWMIIAIAVGCAGLSSVLMLNQAALQDYQRNTQQWLGIHFTLPLTGQVVPKPEMSSQQRLSLYSKLRKAGFTRLVATQYQTINVETERGEITLNIVGIDAPALASIMPNNQPDFLGLTGAAVLSKRLHQVLQDEPDLFQREARLAHLLSLPQLPIETERQSTNTEDNAKVDEYLVIVDMYHFSALGFPLLPEFLVFESEEVFSQLQSSLSGRANLRPVVSVNDAIASTRSFHLSLLALSMVMFLVCIFIVINALNLLLSQRTPLLKTLRQLGVPRFHLLTVLFIELSVYALLAALLGLALGYYLSLLLVPAVSMTLTALYRVNVDLLGISNLNLIVPIMLTSLISTLIAALFPLRKLNKQLSLRVNVSQTPSTRNLIWLNVIWLALFGVLFALPISPEIAFTEVGLSILGGIAVLFWIYPKLLDWLSRLSSSYTAPRWFKKRTSTALRKTLPIVHWSIAHSAKLAQQSRLAIAAFFIALVTHIGMNLMVDSFRTATLTWLEGRLVADYYLSGDQDSLNQASILLKRAEITHFKRLQTPAAISVEGKTLVSQGAVFAYPTDEAYLQGLSLQLSTNDAQQLFTQGKGVFINQQMALRHGVTLDQDIQVKFTDSHFDLKVIGIHHDYGNTREQVLVATSQLQHWHQTQGFSLQLNGLSVHDSDQQTIEGVLGNLSLSMNMLSRDDILQLSLRAFDTTFLITEALNLITLLVAIVSLLTSIMLLQQQNRHSSAILRSLGVSRHIITVCLFGQYALITLLTAIFSIPFGILLGWLLVNRLNIAVFHWLFPLQVSWSSIGLAVLISIILTAVIALWPILRTQRFTLRKELQCTE